MQKRAVKMILTVLFLFFKKLFTSDFQTSLGAQALKVPWQNTPHNSALCWQEDQLK